MNKVILCITAILLALSANSQTARSFSSTDYCTINWSNNFGAVRDQDFTKAVITTDNNIVSTGYAEHPTNTYPSGTHTPITYLVKTTIDGNLLWERYYESIEAYPMGIIETDDGGLLLMILKQLGYGYDTTFLLKTDSYGELQWMQKYNYILYDILPFDGGYFLAGSTAESHITADLIDFVLLKIDSVGNLINTSIFGTDSREYFSNSKRTPDGDFIYFGSHNSGMYDYDYIVFKVSEEGNIKWLNFYGGSDLENAREIVVNEDGSYLLAGMANSKDSLINNYGGSDIWIVKSDSTGVIHWQRNYGGSNSDMYPSICTSSNGYIVACSTASSDYNLTQNHGGYDGWIFEIDNEGNLLWEKSIGGTEDDLLFSILPIDSVNYIVAGRSNSADGDLPGNYGSYDGWLASIKIDYNVRVKDISGNTQERITVYPNPATDIIKVSNAPIASIYSIYNMTGKCELSGIFAGIIDIYTLAPGLYCLNINGSVEKIAKFVKH